VLSAVFAHWSELVGDVVAAHAQPHSLVKGRLIVSVDSPAWATQLRLLAGELLDRLADRIGPGQVAAVELRVHR
jgi:predicted nucleic acid-binding Zn ribbon protein